MFRPLTSRGLRIFLTGLMTALFLGVGHSPAGAANDSVVCGTGYRLMHPVHDDPILRTRTDPAQSWGQIQLYAKYTDAGVQFCGLNLPSMANFGKSTARSLRIFRYESGPSVRTTQTTGFAVGPLRLLLRPGVCIGIVGTTATPNGPATSSMKRCFD